MRTADGDTVAAHIALVLDLLLLVLAIASGQSVGSDVVGTVAATIFLTVRATRGTVKTHLLLLRFCLHGSRVDAGATQV